MIFVAKQRKFCIFVTMKHILLANGNRVAVYFSGNHNATDTVPLVLLHGFCEDSSLWDTLLPHLPGIPVVAIDLPGFGQSDLLLSPDMASYAQAVVEVLDALDLQRCVLVGHSLGGYVALAFAAHWGDKLAGMGLFHSHPFPDNEERKMARMRGVEMLRSGKRDLYVAQLFPNLFSPAFVQAHPEVLGLLIAKGKKQDPEGIAAGLLAMRSREDRQETLKKIACPVLFLLGAEDALVPIDQAWKAAMLPAVALVEILPGVAHMGMFEATIPSAEAIKLFYKSNAWIDPGVHQIGD
jgi:pimeloyl-ACP methyl ester carboxylesterase